MQADEQFREDILMTNPHYEELYKTKDDIEDQTLRKAKATIRVADNLKSMLAVHDEKEKIRNEVQREKASQLVEQLEKHQSVFSRESAVKVLKQAANEKYKEGAKLQKSYLKHADIQS